MDEQSPAVRADQEWDRNSPSVRRKERYALTIEHRIKRASTIELICAFTKTQHRRIGAELHTRVCTVFEPQLLDQLPISAAKRKGQRFRGHDYVKLSRVNYLFTIQFTGAKFLDG